MFHPRPMSIKDDIVPERPGNSKLRASSSQMRAGAEVMSARYIEELTKVNEELLQARRAALNLMEDAIASREALRQSEARLLLLIEAAPIAIGMTDAHGKLTLWNREMESFLPDHVIPSRDPNRTRRWQAWNADGSPVDTRNFPAARALRGVNIVPGVEMLHTNDDGVQTWTRISAVPLRDENGEIGGAIVTITDIDELTRSRERLKEFNELLEKLVAERTHELQQTTGLLQTVLENTYSSIMTLKAVRNKKNEITDLEYQYLNEQALRSAGRTALVGKKLLTEFPGIRNSGLFDKYVDVIEHDKEYQAEVDLSQPDAPLWLQVSAKKLGDGLIVSYFDITRRKEAEHEVLQLKLQQQREILNAILIAQEKERERIGEELHNGVGQLLYAATMRLESAFEAYGKADTLNDIAAILKDAIRDTRNLSFQLVPTVLKDFGLPTALDSMIKRLSSPVMNIRLIVNGLNQRLSQEIEFGAYRIVQELLNNCVKHAHATEITVILQLRRKKLLIEVTDNGRGFDAKKTREMQKGIGLQSVSNRVKLLNAKMKLTSRIGKGTSVRLTIDASPSKTNATTGA